MKINLTRFTRFGSWALVLPLLLSCNIYRPFTSNSSDEDHREEATKCEQDGDYACAISNWKQLSVQSEQDQHLCMIEISQAGIGISVLVKQLAGKIDTNTILGDLATAVSPYTADKATAATQALSTCGAYRGELPGQLADLLLGAALLADVSVRIARTAQAIGTDDTDTACTTTPPDPGQINQTNITQSKLGTGPGMCKADVTQIITDFLTLEPFAKNSTLTGLVTIYNATIAAHPELKTSGAEDAVRVTLQGFLPK
jgi:hypothetical protein